MSEEVKWYVVHTYSGYENKVKVTLEKSVETQQLEEQIQEIVVPMQDVVEVKKGQKKVVAKKVLPGYVIIKMIMNDKTWYVVRNTRGVTGFVGPASKPVALTETEIKSMGLENITMEIDVEVGDIVKIVSGPFRNSTGVIKEVSEHKQTVTVMVEAFGRETPVELDFIQVEKM
ncbi:MAG: transcription termination/antitermination protein NusG [Clostridia bacterium]|nr:transcription termination/antitermination protein NusG [Clostridia bacterium]